jgi:prepilin-type N-terminal cleavage/methylation domain-containing protein
MFINKNKIIKRSQAGFSLIEVIIAMFILSSAVFGTYILVQQTLIAAAANKLQLTAYYLGQEGVEIVRNIRDTNWLQEETWTTGLAVGGGWQEADYTSSSLSASQSRNLKVDADGFYNYSSGTDSHFKRKISVTDQTDYLQVEVVVEWTDNRRDRSVQVINNLYNWYEQ